VANENAQEWTLEGALDEISRIHETMENRSLAFVLGAGASVTSDIPTGATLADKWLRETHRQECLNGFTFEEWIDSDAPKIKGLTPDNAPQFYSQIFERRFRGDHDGGYAELENIMANKEPSLGYSLLAEILQKTRHRVVITTNFDNLVADAIAMQAQSTPLVIAHESLAGFVRPQLRRPLIAKIHRDLLLEPKNDLKGVGELDSGWTDALQKLFLTYTPIFIGYGGNDGSLMGCLKGIDKANMLGRMFWCYREGSSLSNAVEDVILHHEGVKFAIPGFDELLVLLCHRLIKNFDITAISQRMEDLGNRRAERYRKQAEELTAKLGPKQKTERTKESESSTEGQRLVSGVLAKAARDESNWWTWELKVQSAQDDAEKDKLYRQGISHLPQSAELHGNYANFLSDEHQNFDSAEAMYKKALDLDPNNAIIASAYAVFLANIRKDFDAAEEMYKKALDLDPNNAIIIGAYAIFLANNRKDFDATEAMYKKALDLDPNNAIIITAYAIFLANNRKDFDAAEEMYKKAFKLDPDEPNYKVNYAGMLLMRSSSGDILSAQDHSQHVFQLEKSNSHQTGAEALLYLCLCSELLKGDHIAPLGHLKTYLEADWERGPWDFSSIFKATFPHIPVDRHNLYRALGAAILDSDAVKALDEFDEWNSVEAVDLSMPLPE
jgi:protein O-mannosyl-transferase